MENFIAQMKSTDGFNTLLFALLLGIFAFFLVVIYLVLNAVEKSRIKKFTKPKKIYFKSSFFIKFLEDIMKKPMLKKIIRAVSNKIAVLNTQSTASNDMKALFLIIAAIIMGAVMFVVMINVFGAKLWYIYLLYVAIILVVMYIIAKFYADFKEISLAKQLPEGLNDLKIAYDNRKRLKLAIQDAYVDMPREIKREFAKLAEADNLEQAVVELDERVKNPWFRMVLNLMLLSIQKGDREGALSEQLQMLNGIISQEILIKESSRLMIQIYKIVVICSPVFAVLLRGVTKDMGDEVAAYYETVGANNLLALVIVAAIVLYMVLDMIEQA